MTFLPKRVCKRPMGSVRRWPALMREKSLATVIQGHASGLCQSRSRRVTGCGSNWAGGSHQPNPTRDHRTTLHPVILGSSHRHSSATQILCTCKQQWKAERHQVTRLAKGCGRRHLHPRSGRQPCARRALAGRHSSVLRASTGSHQASWGRAIPTGRSKQAEQLSTMPRPSSHGQQG
eukprot:363203-Chlamydomonas_euryale.AAC.33